MFYSVVFLTLLGLTWAEQGISSSYNGKPISPQMHGLFAGLDKAEAAVSSILHSSEHKNKINILKEKLKLKLCNMEISAINLAVLTIVPESICKEIENGKITEKTIIDFLNKDPITHFNAFFKKFMEKINSEAKKFQL
ncbi:uncharacterized protein LOC143930798 [Lithobates pipiens]